MRSIPRLSGSLYLKRWQLRTKLFSSDLDTTLVSSSRANEQRGSWRHLEHPMSGNAPSIFLVPLYCYSQVYLSGNPEYPRFQDVSFYNLQVMFVLEIDIWVGRTCTRNQVYYKTLPPLSKVARNVVGEKSAWGGLSDVLLPERDRTEG